MKHVGLLLVAIVATLLVYQEATAEKKCGECDPLACRPPKDCLAGMVKDSCGCCFECARREGESCDDENLPPLYMNEHHGQCGENLECKPRTDLPPGDPLEAVCVCLRTDLLCGSDGKTYQNECQLTEARYRQRDGLRAMHRGPCKAAPKIASPPENVSNKTGGNVAMVCEATGWPIPSMEWRVDRGDGDTVPLPTDDPKIAVQSRGGPSKYEITSWLQLLNISPRDDATYWCIAKNEEGEASAAARLFVIDQTEKHAQRGVINNDL
uniref:U23-Liphistoxin-Lth1a_1 n=1 Tax=Liphistius thaleban TaxID=1905330 RepID=A0A4Q8K4H7_9ARAC